jgi:hypothetical protein
MFQLNRRTFFAAVATAWTGATVRAVAQDQSPVGDGVPMLHVSDLFRPHNDPDDHWDLACVYALAHQRRADLRGVLIDYPPPGTKWNPDVLAVAQMNYLTGKPVPVMVGAPRTLTAAEVRQPEVRADIRGIQAFLDILRQAQEPVVISVLGSCRDVAIAAQWEPKLFAAKCRAVYVNAGSGTPNPALAERLEWNVRLDPASYAAMFQLPCPVYWMPCFEVVPEPGQPFKVARYGTFYRFRQADVLPHLPDRVQNFFAFMYRYGPDGQRTGGEDDLGVYWLQSLLGPVDVRTIQQQADRYRNMWCTAGFLHACGMTVTRTGEIVSLAAAGDPVFSFDPVRVQCTAAGVTRWEPTDQNGSRYLFQVRHPDDYASAMTTALKTLLSALQD